MFIPVAAEFSSAGNSRSPVWGFAGCTAWAAIARGWWEQHPGGVPPPARKKRPRFSGPFRFT